MKKFELAVIILTVALIGVTAGYMLARMPVAGQFEITTQLMPVTPQIAEAVPDSTVTGTSADAPQESDDSGFDDEEQAWTDGTGNESITDNTYAQEPDSAGMPIEAAPVPQGPVNINTAGLEELQRLTGVGPVLAQRILEDRRENGLYESVDDLIRVKGIGEKTLEKLKPDATV